MIFAKSINSVTSSLIFPRYSSFLQSFAWWLTQVLKIVVVGDTSTGKSSILQALTRLPFPVASDLCTRFVTETTIRRCAPSERPGYKIEVKTDGPGISQGAPFTPKTFDSDEWAGVYQNLKQDIADAFDMMSPDNLFPSGASRRDMHSRHGIRSGGLRSTPIPQLLKHRLEISVRKPDQAHFSIVDIPGLVSSKSSSRVRLFKSTRNECDKYLASIKLT
jgi:GTPase SAR1 family protein